MKNKVVYIFFISFIIINIFFLIGYTYAKYSTNISSNDTARVAKWGITITPSGELYKNSYVKNGSTLVLSSNNVVAPGVVQNSDSIEILVEGESEVASTIIFTLAGNTVYLKSGEYPDVTTSDPNDTFVLENDYLPIKYIFKKNDVVIIEGNMNSIIEKIHEEVYTQGAEINNKYTLSWEWIGNNNKADTLLSKIAEEVVTIDDENYEINESINFSIELEQKD